MKMLRGRKSSGQKFAVSSVAAATALGLVVLTSAPGMADEQNPTEDAEALGQLIETELLDAQLLDAASAYSSSPSSTAADSTPLNLEALGALNLSLGSGLSLPLVSSPGGAGLLDLGNAGALNAFGHAPAANSAKASAGAVGEDGTLNLDDINNGDFGNAKVNLTDVLGQLGLDGVTDQIVDELSLELGAIASTASNDGTTDTSEYVVADGVLTISSPAVSDLSAELDTLVDGTGAALEEVIGTEGLAAALAAAGVNLDVGLASVEIGGAGATVSVEVREALNGVVEDVINEQLGAAGSPVQINIGNGDITVDLAKIVKGADATDLNGLEPNTQVLTADTISAITTGVADALGTLGDKLNDALTNALNDVHLIIELPASISALGVPAVDGTVTVDATLGQLAGTDPTDPIVDTDLSIAGVPVGTILNAITAPVIDAVLAITEPIIGGILTSTADQISGAVTGIVDPVLTSLDPVFSGLNQVVDLTINEQPTLKDPAQESEVKGTSAPGFTVNAVSLELLPGAGAVDVNLASSSVRATPEAVDPDPDANTNAAASASASASADGDNNPAAQVAAQAAANADATTTASAAADPNANAAASSAANETASTDTTADATTQANASSTAAADPAAQADNTTAANADTTAAADADPAAAASVASNATSSNNASAQAAANADDTTVADASQNTAANVNASASANASANADNNDNAVAEAAAQAAALADATSTASAAATPNAQSAAESAANETASSQASTDSTTETNASAQAAATAAADSNAGDTANADTTAAADANPAAAASVASNATSSDDASAIAAANADDSATADPGANTTADPNANATADPGANATADPGANATADPGANTTADPEADAAANTDNANASSADDADQASANESASSNNTASSSSNSSSSSSSNASASSASNGGDLPKTGVDGTLALSGLAALLIAGGAAALFVARRNRNMV